jgi:hypothetical protein
MHRDRPLGDRQTEPGSPRDASTRFVDPIEALKNAPAIFERDARTIVLNFDDCVISSLYNPNLHFTAIRGILHSIVQEVHYGLP